MLHKWLLEVRPAMGKKNAMVIRLALSSARSDASIEVIPACDNLDQFGVEVTRLKAELDEMVSAAGARLAELAAAGAQPQEAELNPAAVWKKMQELPSQEEMFDHFNSFDENARELVADYILGHANMFKGWGPVFAEHYDSISHRLEG